MKLGEILLCRNIISSHQLNQAMQIQSSKHQQLGKILIDHPCLTAYELERSLQEQYWRSQNRIID